MFKSFTSVHEVPLYFSVKALTGGARPPKPNAAICVPAPAILDLAVFKAPPVDHAPIGCPAPNHSSVALVCVGSDVDPPIARAAVDIPAPDKLLLAVLKLVVSDQLDPFHNSVIA